MTYNVFSGMLNPAQSVNESRYISYGARYAMDIVTV